jgi:hypothetical protein
MKRGGRWILDVDVRKFFDTLVPSRLRGFLDKRVTDGVVRRMIDKWLKAGVLEAGQIHYPDLGTAQGGVASPLLANIYLHYVLDEWFKKEVQPRLRGASTLVRFADDFVMMFQYKDDAQRVLEVLAKRLGRFGLQIHPDKTRQIFLGYLRYHSAVMCAALITFAQRSYSDCTNFVASPGVEPTISPIPALMSCSRTSFIFRALSISAFKAVTTSAGIPAGPKMTYQVLTS